MFYLKAVETAEVAVFGEQDAYPVLPAERGDLRIERQAASRTRLARGLPEQSPDRSPGVSTTRLGLSSSASRALSASSRDEGGRSTPGWVTTRTNSPKQKTGRPHSDGPSASDVRRRRAAACSGSSSR